MEVAIEQVEVAHEQDSSVYPNWMRAAGITLVSAIYFADILLKASRKCYWFDELFTVYLCRLSSFSDIWKAVLKGADFNPPLFYLLIRGSRWLFGDGFIATRLPSTIGVWLFGLCLFLFVSRRAGAICGFIAGVFPFFTLARYYAYESRAHGIALGWCGLAILCWQMMAVGRSRYLWLAGFFLSLVGALLTHVYALYLLVPFTLVELYNLFNKRRPDWNILTAIGLAFSSVTVFIYLPLVRAYRTNLPPTFAPASHDLVQRFLADALDPAISIFLVLLLIFAVESMRQTRTIMQTVNFPARELVLALGFACLPALGVVGSKLSHGPFFDRYFLSSIAGYAILLGFATSRRQLRRRAVQVLAGVMLFLMVADLAATVYLTARQGISLYEPSSKIRLSTNPADPMEMYQALSTDQSGLDIMVLGRLQCLYFYMYAPPAVASRLYFAAPTSDLFLPIYERLVKGAQLNLKSTTFEEFLNTHQRFLIYDTPIDSTSAEPALAGRGYQLKSVRADVEGQLYEYTRHP